MRVRVCVRVCLCVCVCFGERAFAFPLIQVSTQKMGGLGES